MSTSLISNTPFATGSLSPLNISCVVKCIWLTKGFWKSISYVLYQYEFARFHLMINMLEMSITDTLHQLPVKTRVWIHGRYSCADSLVNMCSSLYSREVTFYSALHIANGIVFWGHRLLNWCLKSMYIRRCKGVQYIWFTFYVTALIIERNRRTLACDAAFSGINCDLKGLMVAKRFPVDWRIQTDDLYNANGERFGEKQTFGRIPCGEYHDVFNCAARLDWIVMLDYLTNTLAPEIY